MPRTALFLFSIGTRWRAGVALATAGRPQAPQPLSGPCQSPARAGLLFLGVVPRFFVLAVTFGIPGAGY